MSGAATPNSQRNAVSLAYSAIFAIAGLLTLIGALTLIASYDTDFPVWSHEGVLVDATGSKGRRAMFRNNTTLVIKTGQGTVDRLEVKSSDKYQNVSKIRQKARSLLGRRIVYYRKGRNSGRLVSVRTVDGEVIVSAEHTLAAERFTGWWMVIFGPLFGLMGILLLLFSKSKKR